MELVTFVLLQDHKMAFVKFVFCLIVVAFVSFIDRVMGLKYQSFTTVKVY